MILEAEFYKRKIKDIITTIGYFHTNVEIITESTDLKELYNRMVEQILEKMENFQKEGSGWIFRKLIALDIHIDKYKPLKVKCYIPLPRVLANKKAIIDVKNKDNECFKWAITSALFPQEKNSNRLSKNLRANAEKLNWDGLTFPVSVEEIIIFEENNPTIGVNVFAYKKIEVYPIRISSAEVDKKN